MPAVLLMRLQGQSRSVQQVLSMIAVGKGTAVHQNSLQTWTPWRTSWHAQVEHAATGTYATRLMHSLYSSPRPGWRCPVPSPCFPIAGRSCLQQPAGEHVPVRSHPSQHGRAPTAEALEDVGPQRTWQRPGAESIIRHEQAWASHSSDHSCRLCGRPLGAGLGVVLVPHLPAHERHAEASSLVACYARIYLCTHLSRAMASFTCCPGCMPFTRS